MERFIAILIDITILSFSYLKSSMERFIDTEQNTQAIEMPIFKIQYGEIYRL